MRYARYMVVALALLALMAGTYQAVEDAKPAEPEAVEEIKAPEERLDDAFRAITAQLKNTGARLKHTTGSMGGKEAGGSRHVKAKMGAKRPIQQCCYKNMEKIAARLQMIEVALVDLHERFKQEENIEGSQAIARLAEHITGFQIALGTLEKASSKEYAEKVLGYVRAAFWDMKESKVDVDRACGLDVTEEVGG